MYDLVVGVKQSDLMQYYVISNVILNGKNVKYAGDSYRIINTHNEGGNIS